MKVINVIGRWYEDANPLTQKVFDILSIVLGPASAGRLLGYKGVLTHEDLGEKITQLIRSKDNDKLNTLLEHLTQDERENAELAEVLRENDVYSEYLLECMYHERGTLTRQP